MKIELKGEALDLQKDFGFDIEETNPIWNEIGSRTMPATVPASPRNLRLLEWPTRLDSDSEVAAEMHPVWLNHGSFRRKGLLHVTSSQRGGGVSFNVGLDNSTAYAKWIDAKLADLDNLPVFSPPEDETWEPDERLYRKVMAIIEHLSEILRSAAPQETDWAVFPLAIQGQLDKEDWKTMPTLGILNEAERKNGQWTLVIKHVMLQEIDGEETEVSVPDGYGISPFLRVWRVLELIFEALGLEVVNNPMLEDPDLAALVILNNCADAICRGCIKYADLMPDCSVKDFLNALWVRFGLTYNIDYDAGTVDIRLVRDIIKGQPTVAIDRWLSQYPEIEYNNRQYVKLSAATGLDGASPDCGRFEDYVRGRDISSILMGDRMSGWRRSESGNRWYGPEPSGPIYEGDDDGGDWEGPDWDPEPWEPQEPDDPDPQDPEDRDEREETRSMARAMAKEATSGEPINLAAILAREWVTGRWAFVDQENGRIQVVSSSWFDWDPQPEGLESFDLSSADECVPIGLVHNIPDGSPMYRCCPLYLKGARHYHSYIFTESGDGNEEGETPLSFLFAYTTEGVTIGRLNCEGGDGHPIILDNGRRPKYSLYFQWRDGLFAQFWQGFDEILRHGNRRVTAQTHLPKSMLSSQWPMFDVVSLQGVRCLADSIRYKIVPGVAQSVEAEISLRTIATQGNYDIAEEQNVPNFSAALRHIGWTCRRDFFDDVDLNEETLQTAFDYLRMNYEVPTGYEFAIEGLQFLGKESLVRWYMDEDLREPWFAGDKLVKEYSAGLTFAVYLYRRTDEGLERDDSTWRAFMVEFPYKVYLEGVWFPD